MKKVITSYDRKKEERVKVGTYEDGVLTKEVTRDRHLFKKLNAYAIGEDAMEGLARLGCHTIVIIEKRRVVSLQEPNRTIVTTYSNTFEDWKDRSFVNDYGSGTQYFFKLKFLNKTEPLKS